MELYISVIFICLLPYYILGSINVQIVMQLKFKGEW